MPATDPEPASMEDLHAVKDEEGSSTNIPISAPPITVPASTPFDPTTTRPNNLPTETMIEKRAVSMASNDCSSALSSPAEASPAKPAATSPTTIEGTVEGSQATSHIASASDSLTCTGTSMVNISEAPLTLSVLPSTTYGSRGLGNNFPTVLTFKGVSVTLESHNVWKQFYSCGTEMILTKPGRRMFPYCRYRLTGLEPDRQYSLVLSIVPSDQYRYRWSTSKWEVNGPAEHQGQGLIRAFSHHYSPSRGSEWIGSLVSFYKLKLTNHNQDQDGHINLYSMHRYIPRLHVIPVLDGDPPTPDKPVVMGPESMTFTFPQTEFMAVTTYQNFRITQLKINHNPFAKGFREDGHNPRLNRIINEVKTDTQPAILKPAELNENKEKVADMSAKNPTVPASLSNEQETRLVLKPIMSTSSTKDEPFVPCIRGKHALGELVLVQQRPLVEHKEESHAAISTTPISSKSTPGSSPRSRKKRKKINRRWANSRGSMWKAPAASPTVHHSPSLTVAMQPELDDVEGLLFVSFTSKEALEVHVGDKPASSTPSASPVSLLTPMQWKGKVEVIPETDEEKIARLEAILLHDLRVLKHRQVIHPVLQEVGLKLNSLDPTKSIDLQYLGVHLPLPPPNLPEQDNAKALSPGDEGLSFISRTGKTSDMTKIKGWKNKFIGSKETSPSNCDGSQKNLSAFCSNMLDEYLESEAQYISERADAFSTHSEGSVAYQLPVKSSSYVKTLDSVLKHRKAAAKFPVVANRPCPLSFKPLLYSALASPAPPLASPKTSQTPVQAGAQPIQQSASLSPQPAAQRLPTCQPAVSQRPGASFSQSHWMAHRPSGFTKFQLKLLQMEFGALNQGQRRTQLTPDRLSVALSGLLTKQMLPSQVSRVVQCPKYKAEGPECGQEFCTLGCICSSLRHPSRAPFHCRRPECMLGCGCFKRKITKQLSAMESEDSIQPVYSMISMDHLIQPHPGAHAKKLWKRPIDDVDPEPVFIPKSAPLCIAPVKVLKRCSAPRPTQPVREEDKDPVYKYLESLMTCARVRAFNSKPPPELTLEPKIIDAPTPNTAKPQKTTTDNLPKKYFRTVMAGKTAENTSQGTTSDEKEAKKQIEIQSACQWAKDRKMVLEALCRRMNNNRLSRRFWVGPYFIRPVAKIFMRKPSGSIVTYRLHISKPSKDSDHDEEESDDSDEERHASKSFNGDMDAQEDDGQIEESHTRLGVTPFLSGVIPAGRLRARTKPVGCQAYGLIQVNGKSYNQARLLLGNMGSLHPANRLAAFVTGRLHPPGGISLKITPKSNPTNKITTPDTLLPKPAGKVVPPIMTAKKTTDLKPPMQPPVQLLHPDSWKKGSINLLQHPQNLFTVNPFASGQRSSVNSFQNSSTSSPVSLTVSPSLKTPSFLGQSGTYSFRICPPANQGTRGQNLPGVTLPGGFTLIQLPNPGADGTASESVNTTNSAGVDKALPQKDALLNVGHLAANSDANCLGLDTLTAAKDLSSSRPAEPGSSTELTCDDKMPSVENDETKGKQEESNLDIASEDLSSDSDSSDYCGEGDEDDEVVDIETVEEGRQGLAIAQMKEAVRKALKESGDSSDGFGSAREFSIQDKMDDEHDQCKDKRRRKNHTVLERQRRSEQRILFDRLQIILKSDPRAPRLRLLSLAEKEIKNLAETSRSLEEKKRRLTQMQALYVKELSFLSGKPDKLIKNKLKEICERQKIREKGMEWRPFFSHLLQSRAALLQSITPKSKPPPKPLLQPDFYMAPSQAKPTMTAFRNKIMSLLQPNLLSAPATFNVQTFMPQPVSTPDQAEATAPSLQGGQHQTKIEAQQEILKETECPVPAPLPVTAAQDGAPPTSSSIGQGFYTLMVMKPKEEDEGSSSTKTQPSDVDSSTNQDKSLSENGHPFISGSSQEDKTAQSSNSKPKCSGGTVPLAKLALLNKSIFMPSVALQDVEKSQEGSAALARKKKLSTACLSFQRVKQVATSVEPDPTGAPPRCPKRRGRPRKNPVTPVSENEKPTRVEDASKSVDESETSVPVEEKEKMTMEVTKTQAEDSPAMVSDNPAPVKRGKGRPPRKKKKTATLWRPPVVRGGSSPSKSNEDNPVRVPRSFKSPVYTSRPLTRGALGKDFPSAKKRSWIDMEKELEPDLESDVEYE
ncbi:uncharacterized protein mgab isoform X2 [Sebastes fasciatus]|uniref:uncharacterized protein mgab isoform X2 n=1 Tax=Sebastes fasciatus TaxID=394691 RepID=UPI003D9EAFA8